MRLLIMGPQGVGKGTQAALLAEHYGIPAISTGDIFRANIKGKTELGLKVIAYTDKGELVPDELTNSIVKDLRTTPRTAGSSTVIRVTRPRSKPLTPCSKSWAPRLMPSSPLTPTMTC